ncbi:GntR family transcriptional regulator [soil metagenome]
MKELIQIDTASSRPKYQQILEGVIASIEQGTLARGQQLPSISELAEWQHVAKVTVAKAYEELRQRGVVLSQQGKGFYVASTEVRNPLNLFLLFDTLNAYKETLYYAIKEALPEGTHLHLFFHHYDRQLFESLIGNSLGQYNYYVVMPHFNEDVSEVLGRIPKDKLVVIDKAVEQLEGEYAAVYQDFAEDVLAALASALDLLRPYRQLTLVPSNGPFQFVPAGIVEGFRRFGKASGLACRVAKTFRPELVRPGEAFLLFADRDLIAFIRHVRRQGWELGQDVGLISYDDTPMKEILEGGITVISTDFEQMGHTAGRLICERSKEKLANPAKLIRRKSL